MRRRLTLCAVVGAWLFAAAAFAQARPPDGPDSQASMYVDSVNGMSLEDAVAHALEQEPSFRASRSEVDVARGTRVQAGLRPNPTVSFSQQEEPAGSDRQTRAEVLWPLDLFGRARRVDVADRRIAVAEHELADRARLLAADVRARYGDAAVAIRELSILDQLHAAASKQYGVVAARVDEGVTPPLDRDILRVELIRIESERFLQAGVVERALIALERVLGMPPGTPLRIQNTIEEIVQRDSGAGALNASPVAERPDVAAADARVGVADADIGRVRVEGRVAVSLFGMYMRMDASFPQQGFSRANVLVPIRGQFHYVAAGAELSLPIRDRRQGELAEAQARRAGAAAQADATRLTVQAEVAAARARDARARQALGLYTVEARALARQNLTVMSQTYELGRGTVFDLLAEQRRYLDVERTFTMALREAYESRQVLKAALGDVR